MIASILDCADLLAITGYEKPGDAARKLWSQGIHVFEGKAGIWTTLELVNAAGGVLPTAASDDSTKPLSLDII